MQRIQKKFSRPPLRRQTIVITGASSGAGRAAALAFARTGCTLVLAARQAAALQDTADACNELGATAIAVPTDVTDMAAVQELAREALLLGGRIDVWINNAGVLAAGPFDATPVAVHEQTIRTNLMGYIHGAYAAIPVFKSQGHGTLINNISIGGYVPAPYAAGYSASKFGLRGFAASLRAEMSPWPHIHICDLFPAFLDTPGMKHAANYTGAILKYPPVIFDPQKVASAMVSLARHPKPSAYTDYAGPLFRLGYALFPRFTDRIAEAGMRYYFSRARPESPASGNLFEPSAAPTGIYGGAAGKRRITNLAAACLLAGTAAGLYWLGSSRRR